MDDRAGARVSAGPAVLAALSGGCGCPGARAKRINGRPRRAASVCGVAITACREPPPAEGMIAA